MPGVSGNPSGRSVGSKNVLSILREEISQALAICKSQGRPFSALLADWLLNATPKDGATLTRAIGSFMPKEVDISGDVNHFHSLTNEELDQQIKYRLAGRE